MPHRVWNFGAGPATLPEPVLERIEAELFDWRGAGMSVAEMSHRGDDFIAIASKAKADLRSLLAIPADYAVLFLQGGGLAHNALVPLNLLRGRSSADFVVTGYWSECSLAEARKYCTPNIAASGAEMGFTSIPPFSSWRLAKDAAYVHICSNETLHGVEFGWIPDTRGVPLVANASSNLLSRPLDVSRFGLIFAAAQKSIGLAGLTLVIVRNDLLGGARADTPSVFDYTVQAKADSAYNTLPTFAVYVSGLTFEWLLAQGGLVAMERANIAKADLLYREIDRSGFYVNRVRREDRSRMNVPFFLREAHLTEPFLRGAKERGLVNLRGHRATGGARASLYNAMPLSGVQALVDYLRDFEQRHG